MRQKAAANTRIKLSEIFTSIEGEGILFGTKTMFVRMAGCPLKCHWCDTPYALPLDSGSDYSIDSAKELISKNLHVNTYKVNFTGGEPLVQHEALIEIAKFVRGKGLGHNRRQACNMPRSLAKALGNFDLSR